MFSLTTAVSAFSASETSSVSPESALGMGVARNVFTSIEPSKSSSIAAVESRVSSAWNSSFLATKSVSLFTYAHFMVNKTASNETGCGHLSAPQQ
jgi:hypothetical protein